MIAALAAVCGDGTAASAVKSFPEDPAVAWRLVIEGVMACDDADLQRLQKFSLRFVDSPWLPIALAQGWDARELFGIFPAALPIAARRQDCLGLVPSISLSRLGGQLVEINGDSAIIEGRGNRLRHTRRLGGRSWSLPWWQFFNAQE